jgi:hypothetical protein
MRKEVSDHSQEEESRQEEGGKDEEGEEIRSPLRNWLARGDAVTPLHYFDRPRLIAPLTDAPLFARISTLHGGGAREFVADLEER